MGTGANGARAFRTDINGLRAWAVLAVVLYHFGVPGAGGGFVGVDLFFVISGFLMTGIVIRALEQERFSLIDFYLARAKRIIPALAALCALLIGAGWFLLMAPDYQTLARHALYSLGFLSNVEYFHEAGYFDVASHQKWLLHTWSLAVEWQFYMLLPLVSWISWKIRPGRGAQLAVLGLGFGVSLALSVLLSQRDPSAAFFLLHSRAWEMLAGALVFLLARPQVLGAPLRRGLDAAAFLMIVGAVLCLDKNSIWPGWRALLPVGAGVAVLAANAESFWTTNRVAQWLGDRSYSIYLWHWPVYVALAYIELRSEPVALAAGLAASLVLGHFSYAWIEVPTRRRLQGMGRIAVGASAALLVGAVLAPCLLVWARHGFSARFPANVTLAAAESANSNPRKLACHASKGPVSPECVYGDRDWKVIVAGDSHADALVSAVAAGAGPAHTGVLQWTYSSCPFVDGVKKAPLAAAALSAEYQCAGFLHWAGQRLTQIPNRVPVVLINRYASSALGPNEDGAPPDTPEVYFSQVVPRTTPAFLDEYAQHITSSACALAKTRKVYMVRPIPEMGIDVPRTLSRRLSFGIKGEISIPLSAYRARNAWVWKAQDKARDTCGVTILDPLPYLCKDGRCYGSMQGRPLYYDDDHLSEYGNKLLAPMFAEVFRAL